MTLFGTTSLSDVRTNVEIDMTLHRPFGQLNIRAGDYQTSVDNGLTPDDIEVSLTNVYTEFNILTGAVSKQKDIECSAAVNGSLLSFSYLFAPDADNYTITVGADISFTTTAGECNLTVPDVQIRRNYRTTIEGNILTRNGDLNVTIDPEFSGEHIIGIPVRIAGVDKSFSTINEAVNYLNANPGAGKKIVVTSGTYTEDITVPSGITLQGAGTSTVLKGYVILNEGTTLKDLRHEWSAPSTPRTAMYIIGSNVTLESIELEAIVTEADATGFTVKNCIFKGYWKGIFLNNCVGVSVTDSEFVNMNPFSTMGFDNSMTIEGNTFQRSLSAGDSQMIHLIVTNEDAPSGTAATWSNGLKDVVNQIMNDNTWSRKTIRVQCTSGNTFDVRVTAAIL